MSPSLVLAWLGWAVTICPDGPSGKEIKNSAHTGKVFSHNQFCPPNFDIIEVKQCIYKNPSDCNLGKKSNLMELWCSLVAVTMTLMLWTPFISFPWLDSLVSSHISHVALVLNNVPTLSFQTTRESPSSGAWLHLYCSLLCSNIPRTFTNFLVLDCPILLQQWLLTLTSMNTSSGPPLVDVPPFFSTHLFYSFQS